MESQSGVDVPQEAAGPLGQIVGSRFHLRQRLSESEGVRTYRGSDFEDGREVVIQMIAADSVHPAALMRLEYEATHRQKLDSPWMAPVLHVGREERELLIVYAHVPGQPLQAVLQSRQLAVSESLLVGKAIFSALRDMHGHHLLHRGVRPSNVIVNDQAPITAATLVDVEPMPALQLAELGARKQALNGAMYLSPEQAGSIDHDVTETSDLYAAGVTLFHCLAGRPPFTSNSLGAILFDHMTACVPELRALGIAVPRTLDEVIQRLLRKDPRDRYQSAEAVLADLEAIRVALENGETEPAVVIGAHDVRQTLSEPAFVARSHELTSIDEQIAHARNGQAGLILLEGESGGGKTRLLTETTHRAASQGFWALWGQGTNEVARQPFSLLTGIVEGFLSAASSDPELVDALRTRLGDYAPAVGAACPAWPAYWA